MSLQVTSGPKPATRGTVAVLITEAANTRLSTFSPPGTFLVLKKKVAILLSLSHQTNVFLLLLMKAKAFFNWLPVKQPADNACGTTRMFSWPRPAGHSSKQRCRPAAHSLPGPLKGAGGNLRVTQGKQLLASVTCGDRGGARGRLWVGPPEGRALTPAQWPCCAHSCAAQAPTTHCGFHCCGRQAEYAH